MDAREVGRYRVEDARRTDGVVARTGVVAGTTTGVVAGTPGMDAHLVKRYRVEDARPIDGEGEAGPELICSRRAGLVALVAWESIAVGEPWADEVIELRCNAVVRFWHKANISRLSPNVHFRG